MRLLRDFFRDVGSIAEAGYRFFTALPSDGIEFV